MKKILYFLPMLALLHGCKPKEEIEIADFEPFSNFQYSGDTLALPMDLSGAVLSGISIPSRKQCAEGYFRFSFRVRNNTDQDRPVMYKIFYQNETYKFAEANAGGSYEPLSGENFYGSWKDAAEAFHKTMSIPADGKYYTITDSVRILGNPRNEQQFFGGKADNETLEEKVKSMIDFMKTKPDWVKGLKEKAKKEKRSLEEQYYLDALWVVKDNMAHGTENNRWKRNPRAGLYSFTLVAGREESMYELPEQVKNISKGENGLFVNPFYELLKTGSKTRMQWPVVLQSPKHLKTSIVFDLSSGIYFDRLQYPGDNYHSESFSSNCGNSPALAAKAQFGQFFHSINKSFAFENIPVIADVTGENYNQEQYRQSLLRYAKPKDRLHRYIETSDCPCKTVHCDSAAHKLVMRTPGTDNTYRKENVGINTRVGLTYGKYRAKVRFPEIINKDGVWNGLTCAFWLVYQSNSDWNQRRSCDVAEGGYIVASNGPKSERTAKTSYSEIDIEMIKGSEYWPATSYGKRATYKKDDPAGNRNLTVTATNWDLACRAVPDFIVGAVNVPYKDQKIVLHRWDDWYRAITAKTSFPHDSLFGHEFYYEIDWYPDHIAWLIGKSKDKMKVFCYMDCKVTSVPNNQMLMVFTQEYHHAEWWPLSPFDQNFVPFPKNDIPGEILEVEVE